MKKLSFVIPTINRFEYLEPCFISLTKTIKPDNIFINLTIIDDASTDENVINFIKKYEPAFADKVNKIFKITRTPGLCETNLKEIWSKDYDEGYDLFCNLDPDAIFNPNWLIKLIELHTKVGNIVTPFDTHSHGRRRIFDNYVEKNTIGGICMLFDRNIYKTIVEPCLFPSSAWDWEVCRRFKNFYCTNPSYIEHIGKMSSARDSNLIPLFDKAINFIGEQ
jgi:GT2 family glycosyltransferase